MVKETREFIEETKEIRDLWLKGMMDSDMIKNMDVSSFMLLQRVSTYFDKAFEVQMAQAYFMEDLERKLDKILETLEKGA